MSTQPAEHSDPVEAVAELVGQRPNQAEPRVRGDEWYLDVQPAWIVATVVIGVVSYTVGALGAPTIMAPLLDGPTPDLHPVAATGTVAMTIPFSLFAIKYFYPAISQRLAQATGVVGLIVLGVLWGLWVSGDTAAAGHGLYFAHVYGNLMEIMTLSQFAVTILSLLALVLVYSPAFKERGWLATSILCCALYGTAFSCYLFVASTL